jgi:hypothetical protein
MKRFFLFISFLLSIGCEEQLQGSPEPKVHDEYWYRFTDFDQNGDTLGSMKAMLVGSEKVVLNEYWVEHMLPGSAFYSTEFPGGVYKQRSDGIYACTYDKGKYVSSLVLKYPGVVGENFLAEHMYHWKGIPGLNSQGSSGYKESRFIASTSATVTVPGGTYDSLYRYEFYAMNGDQTGSFWFDKDIWMIRYDKMKNLPSNVDQYVDYRWELISYAPQ